MIADETVERVRAAADIVAIIQQFGVPLRRYGGDFRGPCPFHNGKNPNFSVSPKVGSYHCFVCHEKGDVITFVRKKQGLDFTAAVKLIGDIVGIEVIDTPKRALVADPNEPNWEVLSTTSEWFRAQLATDAGKAARDYLASRDIDDAARERFSLGFAPRDPQALRRYLHGLGFDDQRQRDAGVVIVRDDESEPRSNFRNRVMFTILDEFGHHVGFGGRALGDNAPKYLNSSESAVFQKRRTLYGMNTARQAMRKSERAIVVEGYFDVIRLVLAGIEEVVAPLGTALTDEQAALLARYAGEAFLLYDSDAAGQKATYRSGHELLKHKVGVRVVTLPPKEDPDSFVRRQGRVGMETLLAQAIDLFDRQVQLLERRGWFADLRQQRQAVDKLLPTIRAAADPLTRDQYLTRLSDVSHLDKGTLIAEADATVERSRRSRTTALTHVDETAVSRTDDSPPASRSRAFDKSDTPPAPYSAQKKVDEWKRGRRRSAAPIWQSTSLPPRADQGDPLERAVVRAMLFDPGQIGVVGERHGSQDFAEPAVSLLVHALLEAGPGDDLDDIAGRLEPGAFALLRELTESPHIADFDIADVRLNLAKLDARARRRERDSLRQEMVRAVDETEKRRILAKIALHKKAH